MPPKGYKRIGPSSVLVDWESVFPDAPEEWEQPRYPTSRVGVEFVAFKKKKGKPLLQQKLAYYGHKCRYCEEPLIDKVNLTWDHAIPIARGGTNHIANLVPACKRCNCRKNNKTIFEFLGLR